jgi:hypothetical protein
VILHASKCAAPLQHAHGRLDVRLGSNVKSQSNEMPGVLCVGRQGKCAIRAATYERLLSMHAD